MSPELGGSPQISRVWKVTSVFDRGLCQGLFGIFKCIPRDTHSLFWLDPCCLETTPQEVVMRRPVEVCSLRRAVPYDGSILNLTLAPVSALHLAALLKMLGRQDPLGPGKSGTPDMIH